MYHIDNDNNTAQWIMPQAWLIIPDITLNVIYTLLWYETCFMFSLWTNILWRCLILHKCHTDYFTWACIWYMVHLYALIFLCLRYALTSDPGDYDRYLQDTSYLCVHVFYTTLISDPLYIPWLWIFCRTISYQEHFCECISVCAFHVAFCSMAIVTALPLYYTCKTDSVSGVCSDHFNCYSP